MAAKYGSFGANSSDGGGFLKIESLLFSIYFFKFRLLQITLYSIYVLYALNNVILMKKKYSLQN